MTLTLKELEAAAAELNRVLSGARLAGVHMVDPETVLLAFHTPQDEVRVLACVRPRHSRIHRTRRDVPAQPRGAPSHPFIEAARDILGAEVQHVGVRFGDRVVGIEFLRPGSPAPQAAVRGPHPRRRTPPPPPRPVGRLLFECTGHHPNLFFCDPQDLILASLVPSRSHRRDLRPGRRYEPPLPHPSDRMDSLRFLATGPDTLSSLIEAHYDRLGQDEARRTEEARASRDHRREIERLTRLRDGLLQDLAEQAQAAARLDDPKAHVPERDRLARLAARRTATQERLERVLRRIARLVKQGEGPD